MCTMLQWFLDKKNEIYVVFDTLDLFDLNGKGDRKRRSLRTFDAKK